MLHPTDHQWRNRMPAAEESDAAASRPTDDRSATIPVEGSKSTDGGAGHRCPVCEFVSAEYDDVYAHLMTAHRKSTISAALLRA